MVLVSGIRLHKIPYSQNTCFQASESCAQYKNVSPFDSVINFILLCELS